MDYKSQKLHIFGFIITLSLESLQSFLVEEVEDMLQITEIQLIPVRNTKGLSFFASCVLDDLFFIGNIALVSRLDGSGFRCVYPTKVLANGTQIPIFHPINRVVGKVVEEALSKEAKRLIDSPEERLRGKYIFGMRDKDES